MLRIDLNNSDYALEVLSYYIWGEKNKPTNIADEKYANKNEEIVLEFSTELYLKKFFNINSTNTIKTLATKFGLFETFFNSNGKTKFGENLDYELLEKRAVPVQYFSANSYEVSLSHSDFVDIFYKMSDIDDNSNTWEMYDEYKKVLDADKGTIGISFYDINTNMGEEFAKAAFVFGSTALTFNLNASLNGEENGIKYILKVTINPDGTKTYTPDRVENLKIRPDIDNFDFTGGGLQAWLANGTLEDVLDPNCIGNKVTLKPDKVSYANEIETTLTKDEFEKFKSINEENKDKEKINAFEKYQNIIKNYINYFKKIINSDIINYSADGKYVIYGDKVGNTLSNTTTKTGVDLSDSVLEKGAIRTIVSSFASTLIGVAKNDLTIDKAHSLAVFAERLIDEVLDSNLNPHKSRLDNGILYLGGDGDDTITGTDKADIFKGGSGYDTYKAGDGDTIEDDDKGQGFVYFNSNSPLTGGTYDKDKACYVGGIYEYHLNGNTLIVTDTAKNESITINNYSKKDKSLGIDLIEADEIDIIISNATVTKGDENEPNKDGKAPYNTTLDIKLNRKLKEDEFIIIQKYNYKKQATELVLFGTLPKDYDTTLFKNLLSNNKTLDFSWYGNKTKEEDKKYCVGGVNIFAKSDNLTIRDIKPGYVTIKDDDKDPNDDEPEKYDPLVIDLNNDGIKGTNLDYKINFDLDNNGFKEATSWIDNNDAFIAIDKNNNGTIDNGSELFGNKSISNNAYAYTNPNAKNGFEALREFDSNNDGIIDEKDKKFTNLLLWQDKNGNGISETDELIKLSDKAEFTNLNLINSVSNNAQ